MCWQSLWQAHCESRGRPLDRLASVTALYRQACLEVGQQTGVPVADLWAAMGGPEGALAGALLEDGLHFSKQ